ncbi:MAG: ATP-binding cassette domain-containing protein [Clostridium sp.]
MNAVKSVSFTIRAGETFGIVENSGCGKSTIANMLLS